jgi:hypothetical protein
VAEIAIDFLLKHREVHTVGAAGLIAAALQEAYPCPPATGRVG